MTRYKLYKIVLAAVYAAVLCVWFIAWTPFAYALDLQVTGAGTSAINQCYVETSIGYWISQDGLYEINDGAGSTLCTLNNFGAGFASPPQYYNTVGCPTSAGAVGTWSNVDGFGSPAPTLSETMCGVPPPPGPVALGGATSSVDQAQQNVIYFAWTFLACMVLVIWLMRKH